MTDDPLRAALEKIANPELVDAPGGFYCPWCGTNVDIHGTTCPVFISRAALAASATDEGYEPEGGTLQDQGWSPAAPVALDVERLLMKAYDMLVRTEQYLVGDFEVGPPQPDEFAAFFREYAALSGEPTDD